MGWIVSVFLNGMIALGGYWTARHGFRQPSGGARALASATLAWTWMTLGMQALGTLGLIGQGLLLAWAALGMAVGLGCRTFATDSTVEPAVSRGGGWEPSTTCALGLTLWALIVIGVPGLMLPVKVVSDGPIYHLYFAARWWNAGRLFLIDIPFGESAATYFPAGGDLWFTWLMTGWGGDRLAKVGQVPFLLMAAVAVYSLARRLGVGRSAAWIAVSWFVTCLPMLIFSFEANVDTIFVAGYLTAAYFLLRYVLDNRGGGTLALAGLSAGLALGTKPTAVVFVPVLLLIGALGVAFRPESRARRLGHLVVLLATSLAPSIFWYGRNVWLSGNPLYPLRISAFGRVWFAGWYESSEMSNSPYYLPVINWRALCDILLAVFDPRLTPLWLASLAGAWALGRKPALLSVGRETSGSLSSWERMKEDRAVWLCAGLAVVNIALYWLLIPYRTQQRFMLQSVGLAAVPLGRLLDRGLWLRWLAVALLAVHLLTAQSWPFGEIEGRTLWTLADLVQPIPPATILLQRPGLTWNTALLHPSLLISGLSTLIVGLGALALAWIWGHAARRGSPKRWTVAVLATLLLVGLDGAGMHWGAGTKRFVYPFFGDYYKGWSTLEALTARQSTRIAYAGTNLPYYLMGAGLRHEVRYININAHRDWRLHDYHQAARSLGVLNQYGPRPGWNRLNPDERAWLANLRAERIEWLVVTRANPSEGPYNIADPQGFPIERQWADAHPE
ncbi:MAG: glycosyltransferase family 39 protein, partial [Isosphaeraceae bacterium]